MAFDEMWWVSEFILANLSLTAMALATVCAGSLASVRYIMSLKENGQPPEFPPLTFKEALKLPFQPVLYLVLLHLRKKLRNATNEDSSYTFTVLGESVVESTIAFYLAISICEIVRPLINFLVSPILRDVPIQVSPMRRNRRSEYFIEELSTTHHVISYLACVLLWLWYTLTKNWIATNIIATGGAVLSIKHLHLNKMVPGCIFLIIFIIFDLIVFVFEMNIIDTTIMYSNIPGKLMFPRNGIKDSLIGNRFYMLVLTDVILPGAMTAFLLRFDLSLKRNSLIYYYTSLIFYTFGLLISCFVASSHPSRSSHPMLLYLVPCSGIPPLILAFFRGDGAKLMEFVDHPEIEQQNEEKTTEEEEPGVSSHSQSSSNHVADKKKV